MRKKTIARPGIQYRAEDLKSLVEQRADLVQEMKDLTDTAETEKRAFTEEEVTKFDNLDKKVKELDTTIERMERARDLKLNVVSNKKRKEDEKTEKEELEERAFEAYIRGEVLKERADVNLTFSDNGAVIPTHIAQKIIKKVYDICPIYQMATRYNVGGTLNIPYYDEETQSIQMAYATEFVELESTSGKFGNIELKGFLAGALTKVSKSLINNSQFDILSFIATAMAEAISKWIENELLNGTDDKVQGLRGVTQTVTAASATEITTDELIDLQETIPDVFQGGCIWIMNKATRTAIRKFKDKDGNYILNKDATSRWGYTLFGKDVYTSDNMAAIESGKTAVYYGDMSGLAVKLSEDVSIEVLREKYATQHAVGVVGWMEFDSKVENAQKIAKLVMA